MKRVLPLLAVLLWLAAFPAHGDDLQVYGVDTATTNPNVLIIFDTSTSMDTADVVHLPWDASTDWSGPYKPNHIYQEVIPGYYASWGWTDASINDHLNHYTLQCTQAETALRQNGFWSGQVRNSVYRPFPVAVCGGNTSGPYFTGRYLNWTHDVGNRYQTRLSVAKDAINNVIRITPNTNFGLMIFDRSWVGGYLIHPAGTDKTVLETEINGLSTNSNGTPLTEVMMDAGLYFAGETAFFDDGNQAGDNTGKIDYTSPITAACQQNYILLMSDGNPSGDTGHGRLYNSYIGGATIPYLSVRPRVYDVAAFLHGNDVRPTLGTGTLHETQSVRTFTVGFLVNSVNLQDTARMGGGQYFQASNADQLSTALYQTLRVITDQAASILAVPSVPVSEGNRLFAGDRLYLAFFRPRQLGAWAGNLKKYQVSANNEIFDATNAAATDAAGNILSTARSYWSTTVDGVDVQEGGVGEQLETRIAAGTARQLYTYLGTSTNLTASSNTLGAGNAALLAPPYNLTTDDLQQIAGTTSEWPLRDIVHSSPKRVHYMVSGSPKPLLYVGSNGGFMHAFDDETGREVWAYAPPHHLATMQNYANQGHVYYVDGHSTVHETSTQKILIFGERRGSTRYTALDITDSSVPVHLHTFPPDSVTGEPFGFSFSHPRVVTIQSSASSTDRVVMVGGGLDPTFDSDPAPTTNSAGRIVTAFHLANAARHTGFDFSPPSNTFTHSFLDTLPVDLDADGITERVFAVDLAGNLHGFWDVPTGSDAVDGIWTTRKIFETSAQSGRRLAAFHGPDLTIDREGRNWIYFGTGDRSRPLQSTLENRFYAIRIDRSVTATITEATVDANVPASENLDDPNLGKLLIDVTENQIQSGESSAIRGRYHEALFRRPSNRGWYIRLEGEGEKMLSTPIIFAGVVYFTTFTPPDVPEGADPCDVVGIGEAKLYAVDYRTGAPIFDYSTTTAAIAEENDDGQFLDADGNVVQTVRDAAKRQTFHKKDRFRIIGDGLPSAPNIAVTRNGPILLVGIGGGVYSQSAAGVRSETEAFYWRINP